MRAVVFLGCLSLALAFGCSDGGSDTVDAVPFADASRDSGPADNGVHLDAAPADNGVHPDAALADNGVHPDAAAPDALPGDDGVHPDALVITDAGVPEAGPIDAGFPPDAAAPDATALDTGIADTGTTTTATSCVDRTQNGNETGVDCGGDCGPCPACGGCRADRDCAAGFCGADNRCRFSSGRVYVDWVQHCSEDDSAAVYVRGMPAGTYRLNALPSAGTLWDVRFHSPPTVGWMYIITCPLDMAATEAVHTPGLTRYATPQEAYQSITATTATTSWAGGDLRCSLTDMPCGDNAGGVAFQLDLICP